MSYRSRRRSYRGSPGTNFVRQKYQYFVDMQTKADTMQVIKITAGGRMPQVRLSPFFGAFKYFKLGTVKIRFVPAATLPVDPTGLSYEAGEQTVDPRDQMNPGLVRITNGEDVSMLTDILTGTSAERAYYTTMLDPRWYKFQLQSGFKRSAKPLLWNVGQTHQAVTQGIVEASGAGTTGVPIASSHDYANDIYNNITLADNTHTYEYTFPVSASAGPTLDPLGSALMQTGRIRMSWMPTDMFNNGSYGPAPVPEVDLIHVILPKAYKTSYFYRVYIEEEVLFKDAISLTPIVSTFTGNGEEMSPLTFLNHSSIDRYIYPAYNVPSPGNTASSSSHADVTNTNKLNGGQI